MLPARGTATVALEPVWAICNDAVGDPVVVGDDPVLLAVAEAHGWRSLPGAMPRHEARPERSASDRQGTTR